jgi:transcriptional regulator of nitric oxide reductase
VLFSGSRRRYVIGSTVLLLLLGPGGLTGREQPDGRVELMLRRLFPGSSGFSSEPAPVHHFKAFARSPGRDQPIVSGLAFWTTELDPLERGYDGPIQILVGMDLKGVLTGVIVAKHREPYGDFSIDRPEFAAQFVGKSIGDAFRVGEDIDAVSRASISIASATRAIKNSARRVARQMLPRPSP